MDLIRIFDQVFILTQGVRDCDGDDQFVHLSHGVPVLRFWVCVGDELGAVGGPLTIFARGLARQ